MNGLMKFLEKNCTLFENFCFRGKHKPIDLSPSDPKLHNNSVREISFKYYRLSTRQIIHLHMHCLGLQVSVNTVSKILKNKHNSLQCLLFQQTITMQISKQPVHLKVSDHTYPSFLKYVLSLIQKILLCSIHIAESLWSIHAYLLPYKKGQIFSFWLVKGDAYCNLPFYKITNIVRVFWLVKKLWFIEPINSYFMKAIDHTFCGFTGVMTHLGCWENTRNACKSLFSRVLPKSRVGYHAGKPIESVVYCFNKFAKSKSDSYSYHMPIWETTMNSY